MNYNSVELAWLIRRYAIEMTHISHGSHIGSVLSVADIIAVLYSGEANIEASNVDNDVVILSKGHAGAALYVALAFKGFFEKKYLLTHYANGSFLSGHVSHKNVPGIDVSTGSLGHGLPIACGIAFSNKRDNTNKKIFVIIGDGECDEGSNWEAALVAYKFQLNNLIVIIDRNKMASLDFTENSMPLEPLADKWRSFNWNVIEVDGHNHIELKKAINRAKQNKTSFPTVIIASTIKGKGVKFMENNILWHYRFPHDGDEYENAVKELDACMPETLDGITDF